MMRPMPLSRRRLIGAAPAMAAATAVPDSLFRQTARPAAAAHASADPWIEINSANVRHNAAEVHRRAGRPILAVIKNNGYGAGVVEIARLLEPLSPIAGLAVVRLHEAMLLRDAGVRKPILLIGPFSNDELSEAVARDVMPMVYTPVGDALEAAARRLGRAVLIHVCVDTGIGRVGVPYRQAAALIRDLAARRGVAIDGVMMTFSEDPAFDREQLTRFDALCNGLRAEKITLGRRHAASSFTLFQMPDASLDMVRPGMALFGVYSEAPFRTMGAMDLRPAVSLKARVVYVKQLQAGESAGYNRAYLAKAPVWIATLPVGHADGWPRQAAKGARVRIGDGLYPVVASVSASHTIVEIGPEPRVNIGDVATLFDWTEGSRPEDVAASCSASVYDLLMHLGALLPRRVVT
jgi:alanine racemase